MCLRARRAYTLQMMTVSSAATECGPHLLPLPIPSSLPSGSSVGGQVVNELGDANTVDIESDRGGCEPMIRVVRVAGNVPCPCGGTHVRSSGELVGLRVTKVQCSKGGRVVKVSYVVDEVDSRC